MPQAKTFQSKGRHSTAHSVIQVERLNDVPLTEMSWPVAHLVMSLFFRSIPWWYQSDFETVNNSTCHGADVIDLVHWIAVTVCVGEFRVSFLCNNCTNVPWYLLLHSIQALGEANILWIPLMRRQTGNMWARLQLFVCGGSCGDSKYIPFGRHRNIKSRSSIAMKIGASAAHNV